MCSQKLKKKDGDNLSCGNLDCCNYYSANAQVSLQYDVKADISDETGTLVNCRVNSSMLERILGIASDFTNLSAAIKTDFKWQMFLKPMKLSLVIMKPSHNDCLLLLYTLNCEMPGLALYNYFAIFFSLTDRLQTLQSLKWEFQR